MIKFIKKRTIFTDRPYKTIIAFQMIVQYPITMGTRMKIKKQIFELNKNIYMPIRKSHFCPRATCYISDTDKICSLALSA